MTRFDRYLLSQLLGVFGFFALVLVAIHWVNHAVHLFETLIGDGQSAWVFAQMSLLTLPYVISIVLPIASFVAAIYVANRLMGDSELVVMQATGLSALRMMRPVMVFGLVVALMLLILMHVLVPISRSETRQRNAEIAENVTARFLKDGRFIHPAKGVTIYIRQISERGELLDLYLQDDRGGTSLTFTARRALIARSDSGPKLLMFDGTVQSLATPEAAEDGPALSLTRFGDFTYDLSGMIEKPSEGPQSLGETATPGLLRLGAGDLQAIGADGFGVARELHYRNSQPLLAFAGAVIGFAAILTGSFSRFGFWRQVMVALALALVVQAVNTIAFERAGALHPLAWAWLYVGPTLGLAFGLGLVLFAQRPRRVPRALPPPSAPTSAPGGGQPA